MGNATLVTLNSTYSVPPRTVGTWTHPSVDATSSELIIVSLPSLDLSMNSYKHIPIEEITGECYALSLIMFGISCGAASFNISALDINNIARLNTINEVLRYTNENTMFIDNEFYDYTIINRDDPQTNRIYLNFTNNSNTPSGEIRIEIAYIVLQDRLTF